MKYAPFLAGCFALWPVMGVLGAQGYSPLMVIAGIGALFAAKQNPSLAMFTGLVAAFVVWAALTELWSPASRGFVAGNILHGDFAIRSASFRMALILGAGAAAICAVSALRPGDADRSARFVLGVIAVHGIAVVLAALLAPYWLGLVYGSDPAAQGSGIQNLTRNANAFGLVLPTLAAYLMTRDARKWQFVATAVIGLSLFVFWHIGSSAAVIGTLFMLVAMAIVKTFPTHGFRILLGAIAGYVALAPILFGGLLSFLSANDVLLPGSFQSRVWAWHVAMEKAIEAPLLGQGIEASRTWRETYISRPEWLVHLPENWAYFPIVPGHPHNMALQIWSETGLIGTLLAGWAIAVLAICLPSPARLRADIRYAAAGVIGVALSLSSFAYSLWNEAFWASAILAICAMLLLSKRERHSMGAGE
jgi:O-antigen ligase